MPYTPSELKCKIEHMISETIRSDDEVSEILKELAALPVQQAVELLKIKVVSCKYKALINFIARFCSEKTNHQLLMLLRELVANGSKQDCANIFTIMRDGSCGHENNNYFSTLKNHQPDAIYSMATNLISLAKEKFIDVVIQFNNSPSQTTFDQLKKQNNYDVSAVNCLADLKDTEHSTRQFLQVLNESISGGLIPVSSVLSLLQEKDNYNYSLIESIAKMKKDPGVLAQLITLLRSLIEMGASKSAILSMIASRYVQDFVFQNINQAHDDEGKQGFLSFLIDTEYLAYVQSGREGWQQRLELLRNLAARQVPHAMKYLNEYRIWHAKRLTTQLSNNPDRANEILPELKQLADTHSIRHAARWLQAYYQDKAIALRDKALAGDQSAKAELDSLSKDHPEAHCQLAVFYLMRAERAGWFANTTSDKRSAFMLFDSALCRGSPTAYYYYGLCQAKGIGTEPNREGALYNYYCAAQKAVAEAITALKSIAANPNDKYYVLANIYWGCREELTGSAVDFYHSQYWQAAYRTDSAKFISHVLAIEEMTEVPLKMRLALLQIVYSQAENPKDKNASRLKIVSILNKINEEKEDSNLFQTISKMGAVLDVEVVVEYAKMAAEDNERFTLPRRVAWALLADRCSKSRSPAIQEILSRFTRQEKSSVQAQLFASDCSVDSNADNKPALALEYERRLHDVDCSLDDLPQDCFDIVTSELLVENPTISKAGHTYNRSTFDNPAIEKDPKDSDVDFIPVVRNHSVIGFIESLVRAKEVAYCSANASASASASAALVASAQETASAPPLDDSCVVTYPALEQHKQALASDSTSLPEEAPLLSEDSSSAAAAPSSATLSANAARFAYSSDQPQAPATEDGAAMQAPTELSAIQLASRLYEISPPDEDPAAEPVAQPAAKASPAL